MGVGVPLWRATDRREAWVTLGALLLLVVGAPAAGWAGGALAEDRLQRSVRAQHEERRATVAVVVERVPGTRRFSGDPDAGAERVPVVAAWSAPDGTPRTGEVTTAPEAGEPGSPVRIWTDGAGLPVPPPMSPGAARTHAVLGGVGAFLLAAGAVEAGRRLAVAGLVRRRYALLDQEWAATGPDWGRAGTGS
ncbi:Rv1733c family protein [Streptomyces microflavus]